MRVQQGRREAANSTRALRSPISHQAAPSEQEPPPSELEASSHVWIEEMFRNGIIPAKVPVHRSPALMSCPPMRAGCLTWAQLGATGHSSHRGDLALHMSAAKSSRP